MGLAAVHVQSGVRDNDRNLVRRHDEASAAAADVAVPRRSVPTEGGRCAGRSRVAQRAIPASDAHASGSDDDAAADGAPLRAVSGRQPQVDVVVYSYSVWMRGRLA
jgi:hypothetical protein